MRLVVRGEETFASTGNRAHRANAPNVVFVHGAGQDHTIWLLPARYFARHGFNVLSLDLPGHGRSEGALLTSIEAMAEWVADAMDTVGFEDAAVIGHSLGSLVALELAGSQPCRARALALVGTTVPMPVGDALLENAQANDHTALDMLNIWGHSAEAQLGGSHTPGMWMLGGGLRLFERAKPDAVYTDLRACHEYAQGETRAEGVICPGMLILGEKDMMTPVRSAQHVLQKLTNAQSVVIKGAGHALLSEAPEEVLDALIRIV